MNSGIFGKIPSMLLSSFLVMLLAISFLALSAAAYAEEITYAGDGNKLQDISPWFPAPRSYSLFPGTASAPIASGNRIIINYNPTGQGVTAPEFVLGGLSVLEDVAGNNIILIDGQVDDSIFGGHTDKGFAKRCSVSVRGGTVYGDVYGGRSLAGNATSNTAIISGGEIGGAIYGGFSYEGAAEGNTVTVSGGSVGEWVIGGRSEKDAKNNTVTISGGSVEGVVYGGLSHESGATNNSVTISGSPNLTNARIYGGYSYKYPGEVFTGSADITITVSYDDPVEDVLTGNTLNLKSPGISVASVGNFEYYSFDLPEGMAADTVMLSVITKEVFLTRRTVKINLLRGIKLKKGDKVALIHSAAGISGSPKNKSCEVVKPDGALYEFSIYTDKDNLWAEVTKISRAAK